MAYSGEGSGTKTAFWLARSSNNTVCSGRYSITQGSGAHYYKATNMASKTNVKLGGEINTDEGCTHYYCNGYWDEETGGTL